MNSKNPDSFTFHFSLFTSSNSQFPIPNSQYNRNPVCSIEQTGFLRIVGLLQKSLPRNYIAVSGQLSAVSFQYKYYRS
ncbi:MAG: hypothetical protein F6J93_26265 [Oscillatoria sp. SIO1A7]|nr:hypothetical protein [Oscillatoria sp. SIO1A7]